MPNVLPYLIEASDLRQASNDPSFALRFPRLIELLVRASLPSPPAAIRFPSFDTGQIHGYDGYLESGGAAPFVPAGRCIFEFKTSISPRPDAESDYQKRKAQIVAGDASSITFVFVTSASWPGQGEDISQWEATKRSDGHFQDVKIYDATSVVTWLQMHPPVAVYCAKNILNTLPRDFDAMGLDEFAEAYEGSFGIPLAPAVLLAGRGELATQLRDAGVPPGTMNLLADEEEEAASFVCRALMSTTEVETQRMRRATSLVLSDLNSARSLDGAAGLTLILTGQAKQAATRLSQGNSVVICRVFGEITTNDAKYLSIPSSEEFAEALSSSGEISRDQARDFAVKNGRCLTVLRRNSGGTTPVPTWAMPDAASQSEIRAAALCGSWSESHAEDKAIVGLLSTMPYLDTARRLRAFTGQRDSLLVELERIWALRAPVDALTRLAPYIGGDDLERFRAALSLVFDKEKDNVPGPNEIYDRTQLKGHSARLKTGLAQNVLLISALGDVLGLRPENGSCRQFAEEVVGSFPNLGAHPGFLVAFGRELPYFAEAAPSAFLDALEPLLEGDQESLKWFLTPFEGQFSLFAGSHVHALIWALQSIAWIPEYFDRVCETLAKLATADLSIESKGEPRPIYCLHSILTAWAPQTAAPVRQRIAVIRHIARNFPAIAPKLLFELLPESGGAVDVHSRPRFADLPEQNLTYGEIWSFQYAVVEELVRLKSSDVTWFREITTHLYGMRDDAFDVAVSAIKTVVTEASGIERGQLWKILRSEIAKHRQFKDADWAMPQARVETLEAISAEVMPSQAEASTYLFDEDMPDLGIEGWEKSEMELRQRRNDAVEQFISSEKLEELVAFARSVKLSHYVAESIADLHVSLEVMERLVAISCEERALTEQFSRVAYRLYGSAWLNKVLSASAAHLPESVRRVAFCALIADDALVERIETLSEDQADAYWRSSPTRVWDLHGTALETALASWSRVGRDLEVIEQISLKAEKIPSTLLLQLLRKSIDEVIGSEESARRFNNYTFERLFTELDSRDDVSLSDIVKLEWPLIPVLYLSRRRKLAIHRLLATSANDFILMISFSYRPKGSHIVELSDSQRSMADNSGKVLITFNYSPYLELPINIGALTTWMGESLQLADEQGYGEIARLYVGHVVAHAPVDEGDGFWPHRLIREVIEKFDDAKMESGIATERFNMRGVHSDSVAFYRKHAEEGRVAADSMDMWPAVQALLRRIADSDQRWSDSALMDRKKEGLDNSL